MEFNDYQEECAKTDLGNIGGRKELNPEWMYYVLGMAGEMGEFQEKIKKLFRDHNGKLNSGYQIELGLEMGDILWYMARLADKIGLPLNDVAKLNIEKLFSRKERDLIHGDGDDR
jgi:NTP pyrophosphatase (non-canonical NTP hydrolase)